MAPAQLSAEIEADTKLHFTTNLAPGKGKGPCLANTGGKVLRCFEDTMFEMEALLNEHTMAPLDAADHVQVDVIEFTNTNDSRVAEGEDPDATDYSSSFAETSSGTENFSAFDDTEVESQFCGNNNLEFYGYAHTLPSRKKKLTSHWRSFIRPLMWRCKWTELRIKEFESQASKYSREVAAYDQRKQLEFDQLTLEGFGSKSLPYTFQSHQRMNMKRRKRRRVEDATDITSYMSHHNLFSYHENKKSDPECAYLANDHVPPVFSEQNTTGHGINNDLSLLEPKDSDKLIEQILRKIEIVHSRVHKMKAQLDMVMSKNAAKFSSSENLSLLVPSDAQTSSAHSPTFSACNGDTISVGAIYPLSQHMSEYDMGDMVMPDSAISSYGEAIPVPDVIESTVGLLSSAAVSLHQPQSGDSCEVILENVLINNQAAEVESDSLKRRSPEKHQEAEKSGQEETTSPNEQSCLASGIHFPKNKRKRGERRAGSGGWSRS